MKLDLDAIRANLNLSVEKMNDSKKDMGNYWHEIADIDFEYQLDTIKELLDKVTSLEAKLAIAIEKLKRIEDVNSASNEQILGRQSYRDWELRQIAREALSEIEKI